jgi:hypothetical protein
MPGLAQCYAKNYEVFAGASRMIKKQKAKAKAEKVKAEADRAKLAQSQLQIQELQKRLEAIEKLQRANARRSSRSPSPDASSKKRARKSGGHSVSFSMNASPIAGASLAGSEVPSPRGSRGNSPKPSRGGSRRASRNVSPSNVLEGKRPRTATTLLKPSTPAGYGTSSQGTPSHSKPRN